MTTRQHSFYLEDDDWTALRHLCLDRGISVSSFIAQAARDAIGAPVPSAPNVVSVPVVPVVPAPQKAKVRA